MKLYIKHMVSRRCIMMVQSELDKLGLQYGKVNLGEVDTNEDITDVQYNQLKAGLLNSGLELIDNKKAVNIERVKTAIIELVHYSDELPVTKYSNYISEKLDYDYTYLANLFSEATGTTIEHFIISHKIERVKELLLYNELNLTEISYKLHYSSVAHLSNQFKKETGLTPSFFKNLQHKKRIALEDVGIM